ncbi:hypothetical protein KEM54_005121 [Ascosphaera aggregata]|nr:hypothetical protein KEM54_005121 [Ascosphaera aggregata]
MLDRQLLLARTHLASQLHSKSSLCCAGARFRLGGFAFSKAFTHRLYFGKGVSMTQSKSQSRPSLPVQQLVVLCGFFEVSRYYPVLRGKLTFLDWRQQYAVLQSQPEMMRRLGVVDQDVAKWVGWTSAIFSLCQCVTAVPWGYLSDKVGRKPVILTSLCVTMVCSVLFGFSTSLPMAFTARACLGLGNGNVGILRTMVAELVPQKELQPRAFSIMPLIWSLGSIVGPAFGGALADPAKRNPHFFTSPFWKAYPFALPNLVIGLFFVVSWFTGALFLQETLPSKKQRYDVGIVLGEKLRNSCTCCISSSEKSEVVEQNSATSETTPLLRQSFDNDQEIGGVECASQRPKAGGKTSWRQVLNPQTNLILVAYMAFALHSLAFDAALPVFLDHPKYISPVKMPMRFFGGFGMDSETIGLIYAIQGAVGITLQFLFFPPIAHYFGVLSCFRFSAALLPLTYFMVPLTALYADRTLGYAGLFSMMFMKLVANTLYFPCCTILLTNSASSVEVLGTMNGLATSVSGIGRALGPACIGWIFSLGAKIDYMLLDMLESQRKNEYVADGGRGPAPWNFPLKFRKGAASLNR